MPKRSAKPEAPPAAEQPKPAVLDPFNVPVQFVDSVLHLSAGALGIANLVLGTWHVEPGPNGEAAPPHIPGGRSPSHVAAVRQGASG
jgi:hypothetical protein